MARECPYCEGREVFQIANTNIRIPCTYCDRGRVIRPGESIVRDQSFFDRIKAFFGFNST